MMHTFDNVSNAASYWDRQLLRCEFPQLPQGRTCT